MENSMKYMKLFEEYSPIPKDPNEFLLENDWKESDILYYVKNWVGLYGKEKGYLLDPELIELSPNNDAGTRADSRCMLKYDGDVVYTKEMQNYIFPAFSFPLKDRPNSTIYTGFDQVNILDVSALEKSEIPASDNLTILKFVCKNNPFIRGYCIDELYDCIHFEFTGCSKVESINISMLYFDGGSRCYHMDLSNNNIKTFNWGLPDIISNYFNCSGNNLLFPDGFPDIAKGCTYDLTNNPWLYPPLKDGSLSSDGVQWNMKESVKIFIDRYENNRISFKDLFDYGVGSTSKLLTRYAEILNNFVIVLKELNIDLFNVAMKELKERYSDLLLTLYTNNKIVDELSQVLWDLVPDNFSDIIDQIFTDGEIKGNWVPPDLLARMKKYDHSEYRDSKLDSEWKEVF